jgi:thioredoxin-related protein
MSNENNENREIFHIEKFRDLYKIKEELAIVYLTETVWKPTVIWMEIFNEFQLSESSLKELFKNFKNNDMWFYLTKEQNITIDLILLAEEEFCIYKNIVSKENKNKYNDYLKLIN